MGEEKANPQSDPIMFQKYIADCGLIETMYAAMESKDVGETVMAAKNILEKTKKLTPHKNTSKSKADSESNRILGDTMARDDELEFALESYNQALMCAPKGSTAMMYAYQARANLCLKMKAFEACLKDIDMCLTCKPPSHVIRQLNELKEICRQSQVFFNMFHRVPEGIENFLKLDPKRNPYIPCAIDAVDIVMENSLLKVIATKGIETGSLVVLEKAFVSSVNKDNKYIACHYCHKLSFNLFPCDECSEYLFCSEDCKLRCIKEYHNVECKIIEIIELVCDDSSLNKLAIKAALKVKNMCSSWDEFIEITKRIGLSRLQDSSINEIFDVNNKLSVLCYDDDTPFIHGRSFNTGFSFATIICHLKKVPSYFPNETFKKEEAMKALGRLMLHLALTFPNKLEIQNAALNFATSSVTTEPEPNYGYFSFTSKLKHKCDANLLCVGLNDHVALVALRDIKKGEELNISYTGHWYENMYEGNRAKRLLLGFDIICNCRICVENWSQESLQRASMNKQEKAALKKWRNSTKNMPFTNPVLRYKQSCLTLNALSDQPNTFEHYDVFRGFRTELTAFQYHACKNSVYNELGI